MFALRGLAVSLSVFAMVYCVLSLVITVAWRKVLSWMQPCPVQSEATILFATRILPFVAASVITAAITVPSFLLLEPRAIDEPVGLAPIALGTFGAALGTYGLLNALAALRKASRTVAALSAGAELAPSAQKVPVLRISQPMPPMTAVGIVRPRILLSHSAESALSLAELGTALNHESAHIHSRDNLKKLLLRFTAFPRMRDLETAWLGAAEMAADDAAVHNSAEALDLASALIKLSRFAPVAAIPDLAASLVHSPASIMNIRIQRLIAWSSTHDSAPHRLNLWFGVASALAALALFVLTYSGLLARAHTATEWLVR